jgi:hypothetical protein
MERCYYCLIHHVFDKRPRFIGVHAHKVHAHLSNRVLQFDRVESWLNITPPVEWNRAQFLSKDGFCKIAVTSNAFILKNDQACQGIVCGAPERSSSQVW